MNWLDQMVTISNKEALMIWLGISIAAFMVGYYFKKRTDLKELGK